MKHCPGIVQLKQVFKYEKFIICQIYVYVHICEYTNILTYIKLMPMGGSLFPRKDKHYFAQKNISVSSVQYQVK